MSTETKAVDIGLDVFTEGVELLGKNDLEGAAAKFEQVIAETDGRHLRDRARQYLAACHRRKEDAGTDDPYLAAVYRKNQGRLEEALELCAKGDGSEKFVYLEASLKCLSGEEEEALSLLEKAIELDPKSRVHAFHDSDFENLHGTESFTALINPPRAEAT